MIAEGSVLDTVLHVLAAVLLIAGSFLSMVAGIGIARFPDLLARMHAATKPQVLGLAMLMTGLALEIRTGAVIWTLVLVVAFQLITAPVSAHMVGRAGYRTSQVRSDLLIVDELTDDLELLEDLSAAEEKAAQDERDQRDAAQARREQAQREQRAHKGAGQLRPAAGEGDDES